MLMSLVCRVLALLLALHVGAVQADEGKTRLRVGDIVYVALPGEESLNKNFRVERDGRVLLPEIGSVAVAGQTVDEARELVRASIATVFRDTGRFEFSLKERRLLVTVLGYVKAPGPVDLGGDGTIQMAINAAGGLLPGAQLDRMQVRRNGKVVTFDYKRYLDTGDLEQLATLEPLDTIFVPVSSRVGNVQIEFDARTLAESGDAGDEAASIKVFGEVNKPGVYSYKQGATIVDVIMRAGGVTRYAGVDQIRVIQDGQPAPFNLRQFLDTGNRSAMPGIGPGATIFVPQEATGVKTGASIVYVMGEVAKPGAFEMQKGAGFIDVLANAGGPTRFAETRQVRILRSNGSVESLDLQSYTDAGAKTRLPAIHAGDAIFIPEKTDQNEKSWLKVPPQRAVSVMGAVHRPGRYEWSDEMTLLDLLAHAGGPTPRGDIAHVQIAAPGAAERTTFDLGTFVAEGGRVAAIPKVRAGYTVFVPELPQGPADNKAQWLKQRGEDSIHVFGQVGVPGRYAFNDRMTFLDILSAANGPTGTADIHNIRITHRSSSTPTISKLNLAVYFETGDPRLLPRVLPGDVIYVPDRNRNWLEESKESTVRVLGSVNKPGRYRFDDSMTILDLLAEAGGPTAAAYHERIVVVNTSCCADRARSFDLVEFAQTGDFRKLPVLRAGDTVYVPDRGQSLWSQITTGLRDVVSGVALIALLGAL